MGKHWKNYETNIVLKCGDSGGIPWVMRNLAKDPERTRSYWSICSKIKRMKYKGFFNGYISLREASEILGVSYKVVKVAKHALHLRKVPRSSEDGQYLFTAEQIDEINDWLQMGYWSPNHKLYGCYHCGESDDQHRGYGLCANCYYRYRYKFAKVPITLDKLLPRFLEFPKNSSLFEAHPQEMKIIKVHLNKKLALPEKLISFFIDNVLGGIHVPDGQAV